MAEPDDDSVCPEPPRTRRNRIVEDLFGLLERKMDEIKDRMDRMQSGEDGTDLSPADSERDARTLNTLSRLLEKLTTLEGEGEHKNVKEKGADLAAREIDAEPFRQEIAERLARMLKEEKD